MGDDLKQADARAQAIADDAADELRAWGEKNLADGGVCDFCCHLLEPGHFATYVAEPMISSVSMIDADDLGTGTLVSFDDSNWAACEKCDPFVAEGDPLKLTAHVLATRDTERGGEFSPELLPMIHASLVDYYTKFFEGNPQRKDER